jgi:hypothetical protein
MAVDRRATNRAVSRPTAVWLGAARLLTFIAAFGAAATGRAEGEQPIGDAGGALPGFVRVGAAVPADTGLVVAALAGYGYRGAVVADSDNHHRAAVDLATSFRPLAWLSFAARFSGRYDRHTGTGSGIDSGWVGDPRVAARAAAPLGGGLWLGAQLGLWMPGRDAPSLDPSATTADLVGLVTWSRPGLAVGAQLGFRYDRSAESVDSPELLSPSDRIALGVSEANAVLVGAAGSVRTGAVEWIGEWSWDVLVGDGAPERSHWPMRVGGGLRTWLTDALAAQLAVEYSLASTPEMEALDRLFPIEPRLQALAGLTFQPGRRPDRLRARLAERPTPSELPAAEAEPAPAGLDVAVTRTDGQALAGAQVVIEPPARSARTGDDGRAEFEGLAQGRVSIRVSHPDYRPSERTIELAAGQTAEVAVALEPALPPGQLRGLVRSFRGRPLAAKLKIEPIGLEARCDPRGEFEIDLPPGVYDVAIDAAGYRAQKRRVRVERDGVTILNVDMRR